MAIGIIIDNDSNTGILSAVHSWLSNERNGKWVMIIDNADDMDVWKTTTAPLSNKPLRTGKHNTPLGAAVYPQLQTFLPDSRNGQILVTSRNREVARLLIGSYSQILQVDEMNEPEAIELFSRKTGGHHNPAEVATLAKRLDCIPLAISQAASYIAGRVGRTTIIGYMDEIANLESTMTLKLLETSMDESHRAEERSSSVVATWLISFRYIERTTPSAAQLLSFMCLFDRQRIPEELLVGHYTLCSPTMTQRHSWWRKHRFVHRHQRSRDMTAVTASSDFDRDHRILNDFALIKTEKDGQHFEMHRLVQLTMKRWLEVQDTLLHWTSKYVALMHATYPWPEESSEAWKKCQALYSHAKMARAYRPAEQALLRDWGFLLQNAAAYAHERGLFQDAEDLNRDAVGAWESTFGKTHLNTLRLLSNLAQVLYSLNRLTEAEHLHRRILACREQTLGTTDEETLKSVYALGNVLLSEGKLADAERMYRRALDGREKMYGITQRDTRLVVGKLMSTLRCQNREEEADELLLRAFPSNANVVP
jgi:hypothetical protein